MCGIGFEKFQKVKNNLKVVKDFADTYSVWGGFLNCIEFDIFQNNSYNIIKTNNHF